MSPPSPGWALLVANYLPTLLGNMVYIAFLTTAFGVVRRHRPDAWSLVASWAAASMALSLLHRIANVVIPTAWPAAVVVEAHVMAGTTVAAVVSLLRTAVDALLVLAVVRLARGPDVSVPAAHLQSTPATLGTPGASLTPNGGVI